MTREPPASPAPPPKDDERATAPQDDRLRDAAGRDVESGRNSGRTSDDTRDST